MGHAVRTVDDALALGRTDVKATTALLDMRFLAGDAALYQRLAAAVPRLFQQDANFLVKSLCDERVERHNRFGDTVFLLEPNVKSGPGAYRDLLLGWWAAKSRLRVDDFPDLVALGQASPRQAEALVAARRFFLQLRVAAHRVSRRRADRLTFEVQEAIAPLLFPDAHAAEQGGIRPAVAPAVEALMQRYFITAKTVARETTRLLERFAAPASRRPEVKPVDGAFVLHNGKLAAADPATLRAHPADWMRIFNVALALDVEIAGGTKELIAELVATRAVELCASTEAQAQLLQLVLDDRDRLAPSRLEEAHELGLLAALWPEFAPCTGRVQHDLYHVYTVDQHQIYALGRLKELARGELANELPAATLGLAQVERRTPLYLGTLLHDVGKPLGKGHSESGARLTARIGARLGLAEADTAQTEFLVRKHLVLAHLSQRRDLNDAAMIANLAAELTDEESLRELYLLTVSDMSMVAPGNLTEWKEQLLTELYERTRSHYRPETVTGGDDAHDDDAPAPASLSRSLIVAQRQARVALLLSEPASELAPWFAEVGERYVAQTAPRQIARHVQLTRRRAELRQRVLLDIEQRPRRSLTELTVVAADQPGLLAKIAGVLVAHRIEVWGARIHSRQPARGDAEALDLFHTRDRQGRLVDDAARWQRVSADLTRVLDGTVSVEALVEAQRKSGGLPERVRPHVATEVEIDDRVSADFTVVDVFTQDRPGVLYTIAHTLAHLSLDIHLSKVATEGDRVADVFYVRRNGQKLDGEGADQVRGELRAALERLAR